MFNPRQTQGKTKILPQEFSLFSLLRACWKRGFLLVGIWVLITAAAVAVVHRLPAIYTSEVLILVDAQKIPERFVSSTVQADIQDRLATISQQMLSTNRLQRIIDDFNLYREQRTRLVQEEIVQKMRRDIAIKLERGWTGNKPGAFRIGYEGSDPVVVAQVANRIANLYIEENLKTREVQAEGTTAFLDSQLREAKKRLDEMEAAVSEYKRKFNGELPQQESTLGTAVGRLHAELNNSRDAVSRARDSRTVLENTLSIAEASLASMTQQAEAAAALPPPTVPVVPAGQNGAAPAAAPAENPPKLSKALEAQLETFMIRYGEGHPDVKRLRLELADAKRRELRQQEEAAERAASVPPATAAPAAPVQTQAQQNAALVVSAKDTVELARIKERVAAIKAQMAALDSDVQTRSAEQERITRDIADYEARLNRLPMREQELAQMTRDYEINKANYRSVLDKKMSAEMSTDMERRQKSERFTIIDQARVAQRPFKPNRPLFDLMGCVAGLLTGLVFAIGIEMHKGVLLGDWELPEGIPIMARLPQIRPLPVKASEPPSGVDQRRTGFKMWKFAAFGGVASILGLAYAIFSHSKL